MTVTRIAKIAAAVSLALAAGIAAAGNSQSLSVTASVTGVCKFDSGQSPVLAFGAIDPSGTAAVTASVTVNYHCTKGTSSTVTLPAAGTTTMSGTGSNTTKVPYTLSVTSGGTGFVGTGFGTAANPLVLGGSIAVTDYQNAPADSYSQTVTLTVAP